MDYAIKKPAIFDVSHWEGRVNWDAVVERFGKPLLVICKITEGDNWYDDTFEWNWSNLKRLGVNRSCYHFWRFERPAIDQANWFLKKYPKNDQGEVIPWLDAEWKDYRDKRTRKWVKSPRGAKLCSQLDTWMDKVDAELGITSGVYSSPSYVQEYMCNWLGQNQLKNPSHRPFWGAWYPYRPDLFLWPDMNDKRVKTPGWNVWALWQYAENGLIPGIPNDGVDLNLPGMKFWELLSGVPVPPAPTVPSPIDFPHTYRVVAHPSLRVRSGPGVSYPIKGYVYNGQRVQVMEVLKQGENYWGRVGPDSWIATIYNGVFYVESV